MLGNNLCHDDFFAYENNFTKYQQVKSKLIYGTLKQAPVAVSITIPTYRRPQLLQEAILSALTQIGTVDYEILIVDNDADGVYLSQNIAFITQLASSRIRYYKNEQNIGMFGNWNRCIELANGEWMTILSDDDILRNNYLIQMKTAIDSLPHIDRIECGYTVFKLLAQLKGKWIKNWFKYWFISTLNLTFKPSLILKKQHRCYPVNLNRYALGNRSLCMHSSLFRQKNAVAIGGFNEKFFPYSDFIFNLNYHYQFNNYYKMLKPLVGYRILCNENANPRTMGLQVKGAQKIFNQIAPVLNYSVKDKWLSTLVYRMYYYGYRRRVRKSFSGGQKLNWLFCHLLSRYYSIFYL